MIDHPMNTSLFSTVDYSGKQLLAFTYTKIQIIFACFMHMYVPVAEIWKIKNACPALMCQNLEMRI